MHKTMKESLLKTNELMPVCVYQMIEMTII